MSTLCCSTSVFPSYSHFYAIEDYLLLYCAEMLFVLCSFLAVMEECDGGVFYVAPEMSL